MPSVRYYNQSAPFWDFVANLESQGSQHPFFGARVGGESKEDDFSPFSGWAFGAMPHRGRHGFQAPPPPPDAPAPPSYTDGEKQPAAKADAPEAGPSEPQAPPRCGGREHCGRRRGGWHGRGFRSFPYQHGPADHWAEMLKRQIFGDEATNDDRVAEDFKPAVDVFDAPESFVVHISLPGAKKEDVGVSWDAEKSELSIAGVIYRPGDEEFLKTLALNERSIGAFERKVRLGSRANPAQVDVDAISAKMEDGVLTVDVPKLDSGYVEVKKVDVE